MLYEVITGFLPMKPLLFAARKHGAISGSGFRRLSERLPGFVITSYSIHYTKLYDTWGIGPNIHIPLFEGGKLRAGLEKSRARYAEVYDSYRQTVIRAFSYNFV